MNHTKETKIELIKKVILKFFNVMNHTITKETTKIKLIKKVIPKFF